MKIIENKQIVLSDVFYFIKNETRTFDTIELINEFGLESKEEYIQFIYNEIRLNVPKEYYSYLLISIHSNNKNKKLINMKFEREINNIDIKEFEILKVISDNEKTVFCLKLASIPTFDSFKKIYNYENTIILSEDDISNELHVKIEDTFLYQIDFNKIIDNINSKMVIISDYKASDADTFFIIKG